MQPGGYGPLEMFRERKSEQLEVMLSFLIEQVQNAKEDVVVPSAANSKSSPLLHNALNRYLQ
jgi:hypothetical protein